MAQTPEGKVKHWLYGTKTKPGIIYQLFPDVLAYKPPGGMFGQAGVADGLFLWHGVFFAIEVKADGNLPSVLQTKFLKHVNRQGGVGAVLIGRDMPKMRAIFMAVSEKAKANGFES